MYSRGIGGFLFILLLFPLLLFGSFGLAGCTRTVAGGYTDSPDGQYRMYGRVFGAVRITILKNEVSDQPLFTKVYRVVGSDVTWHATWRDKSELTVVVYDYGAGVSHFDVKSGATNYLGALAYKFDRNTGRFVEQAAKMEKFKP
jgi:hypothetical protein